MKNINKIDGIKILRFISALAILIWHYQHFNYPLTDSSRIIDQPFFNILKIFYTKGYMAVNFFWCISGFIFFWKYGEKIKNITFAIFFKSRFSRLYPLHFLTLILVLILQKIYFYHIEDLYIYKNNDFFHFILQFFMASNWGFENASSFNGPIWSISIEVIIYGFFFILLKTLKNSILVNLSIILICLVIKIFYEHQASQIVDCALFFFTGGCVSFFINYLENMSRIILKLLLAPIIFFLIYLIIDRQIYNLNNFNYIFQLIFFPLTIFFFCDISSKNKNISNLFSFLGNLTYSSYLLHFPVQLLITIFFIYSGKEIPFFNNYFFIFYISFVLSISWISYNYFENPMKNYIRNNF